MRSSARMANRQRDVDLREAQVDIPHLELWLGLAWLLRYGFYVVTLYLKKMSSAVGHFEFCEIPLHKKHCLFHNA